MAKCQRSNCEEEKLPGRGSRFCAAHRGGLSADMAGELDYFGLHALVRKVRGNATLQVCAKITGNPSCAGQAKHWATIHDRDGKDIYHDYIPLCISCHHAYDGTHERAGFHGRSHSEETRIRMSQTRKGWSWLDNASDEEREKFGNRVSAGWQSRSDEQVRKTSEKMSKSARNRVQWNKGGTVTGPDGKLMGRVAYEAEAGQSCEV